jgi:mono/diheme cytochrome c family protein
MMDKFIRSGAKVSLVVLSATFLLSCGRASDNTGTEYAPQMYDAIAYEPLKQLEGQSNPYNPGGLNLREPAKGTVARGKLAYYDHIPAEDAEAAGTLLQNPMQATELNLADGKILYTRFCSHCHGETGAGDGLVGEKFKGVPNFQAGRYATLSQGHVYHVITNGRGRMMPHGSQVNPEERWKISLYVRQLQLGEAASTPVDVPQGADSGASSTQDTNPVTGTEQNMNAQPSGN